MGSSIYFDDGPYYDYDPYIEPIFAPVVVDRPVIDTVVVETPMVQPPIVYPPPAPLTVEVEPPAPEGDAVQRAASLLRQGDDAFHQGRYEDARRLYVEGVALDESNGFAHLVHMLPAFAVGEYGVAASSLRQALTLEPTLIDQPLDPQGLYGNTSDFDQQVAALQSHLARSPQDMSALFVLSYLLYGTGDTVAAGAALDDLVRQQSGDTVAHLLRDSVARTQKGSPISSQPAPL